MLFKPSSFIASILLATQVRTFRVTFYSGYQCHGARLGTGNYGYPGFLLCHNVPINAASATIEREPNDNEGYAYVAFWRECGEDLLASGDGNCINFLGAAKFSVRDDYTVPGKQPRSASAAREAVKNRVEARADSTIDSRAKGAINPRSQDATAPGSLSPSYDPDLLAENGFGHGSVSVIDSQKNDVFVPYGDF
ncbi:hypothetical protein MFIFM68171_00434 [Madurella fahalii]|uniref:Uncharacterized protein n=1 Tax=Madurella fahalii TaxID=1157608 RepID=A0ABQ0FXL4_9PEZI